jgi:hypothetical protein
MCILHQIHEAKGGCQPDRLDHRASLRKFTCFDAKWAISTPKRDHKAAEAWKKENEGLKAQIKHLQAELAARKSISGLDAAVENTAEEVDEQV